MRVYNAAERLPFPELINQTGQLFAKLKWTGHWVEGAGFPHLNIACKRAKLAHDLE